MFLNRFTNNIEDPLHTNGFAAAAKKSGGVGSTGPQSFRQRLHIERNRQNVNRYHDSMIANNHHREKQYQRLNGDGSNRVDSDASAQNDTDGMSTRRPVGRVMSDVIKPTVRPRFNEPPTRGYNPYK